MSPGQIGGPADFEMVVTGVAIEAVDVVSVTIARPGGIVLPAWLPGAHLDLRLSPGLERQYSLCGDPDDHSAWRVAVLREPNGRGGSEWVHTRLQVGDHVQVTGPRNTFPLVSAKRYLMIAGGIGITPLLPMIRDLDKRNSDWRLLYGGRHAKSMAFLEEIEHYGDRVIVRPQDVYGLLDLDAFVESAIPGTVIYCCGPEPLINAVERACEHWPSGALHVERFHPRAGALEGESTPVDTVLDRKGVTLQVPADKTIAEVLDAAGIEVATSCREGTCGTCETDVLEGVPDHRDSFLSEEERAENATMMICCSRSKTPTLILDI